MSAYTVYLEQLPALLARWAKTHAVHVPTEVAEKAYDFRPWDPQTEIAWDYDLAYNPLKRFFLPPKEDLITYNAEDYTSKAVYEAPAQLLLGVHPYDLKAISQLDQLMEAGSPDRNYLYRRENTLIFGLEPIQVAETSFWTTVGRPKADIGYDLYWTQIGPSTFFVEVGSPKGEEMLLACGDLPKASLSEYEAARVQAEDIRKKAERRRLNYPWQEVPNVLSKSWDSTLWREKAHMCLACGSCNLVCPTCYCFDIKEEVDDNLKTGRRYREWDGCMLNSFALVAGGHNFRSKALERLRHRYFRKGKYIFDLIGELGCVGCGRCVKACTADIADPLTVFNQLWEETR